jgi:hypothetical protein
MNKEDHKNIVKDFIENRKMPYKIGQMILYEYFSFGFKGEYKGYKTGIIKKVDHFFTELDGVKIEYYHFYYEVIEYTMIYQGKMISFPSRVGDILDFFPNSSSPPIILDPLYPKQLNLFSNIHGFM